MPIVAFDNIEFKRGGKTGGEFYTPLGAGIWFKDDGFRKAFNEESMRLATSFHLYDGLYVRSAGYLKYGIGLKRAIPFCDQLISSVQNHIREVSISYVIMPPSTYPEVEVGGLGEGTTRVKTAEFLRQLSPAFSHIMAWSFLGKTTGGVPDWEMHLDGFQSKYTQAWYDLTRRVQPKVFPHGDECDPHVNLADLISFMTNIKLGAQMTSERRKLTPDNAQNVWANYSFRVNARFLDPHIEYKLAWRSDELIDLKRYYVRPMTFIIADPSLKRPPKVVDSETEEMMKNEPTELSGVKTKQVKRPKFKEWFEKSDPGIAVANYAYFSKGAFQHFDPNTDQDKIADGDTIVYAGSEAKRLAVSYADMYDIKVMSMLELRKEVERLKQA